MKRRDLRRLSAYLDGELDARRAARVAAWLERSEEARRALASLAGAGQALDGLPAIEPRDGFADRLAVRVAEERQERVRGWWRQPLPVATGALSLACGVALALVLAPPATVGETSTQDVYTQAANPLSTGPTASYLSWLEGEGQ